MGALLESLLTLQDLELQIVDIRRQLATRERAVERQAAKVRAAEQALDEERAAYKRAQAQQDELDVDLKTRQANVTRLRENLNSVRTNKEYAALMSQLNNEKADTTRLETRAYELLEGVEVRKRTVAERQAAVDHDRHRLTDIQAQLEQGRQSFADRLGALERQRGAAAENIDAKSLDLFNRISERYEGEVMARVVRIHPRRHEYMCEGCNMALAAERANALLTRDDVITCGNCGRILHINKSA
jgi:predicted  nucleic acid-binding Zn-ribbon protein